MLLRCHMAAFEAVGGVPDGDLLPPDEDRRHRRSWRQHRLQPGTCRFCPARRPPAQGLPAVAGKNQGKGRHTTDCPLSNLMPPISSMSSSVVRPVTCCICRVNLELLRSDIGPDVWSGRASQEVFVDLSDVGLASMYPASHWSVS